MIAVVPTLFGKSSYVRQPMATISVLNLKKIGFHRKVVSAYIKQKYVAQNRAFKNFQFSCQKV